MTVEEFAPVGLILFGTYAQFQDALLALGLSRIL